MFKIKTLLTPLLMLAGLSLIAQSVLAAPSLNQAAYKPGTTVYEFGYNSIPNIKITGAPADTNWSRSAMLHDGTTYRLYFFKGSSKDTLYQFGFNQSTLAYEYGFQSIPVLRITGAPSDVDASTFAMLHDGKDYRLYMRKLGNPSTLYQFAFNRASNNYEYGYNSIKELKVTGMPSDAGWDRWAMLHDGSYYRFYVMKSCGCDMFYQAAFNPATNHYEYGYQSLPQLTLEKTPSNSNTNDFAMLHDKSAYRFYFLTK